MGVRVFRRPGSGSEPGKTLALKHIFLLTKSFFVRDGLALVRVHAIPQSRVEIRNPALYLNGDLMYSVKSEISQEGEGESAPGLWSESSDVERIPSPICSQRSDGIWSVEARIHKVDPNIAPD